MDLAAWFLHLLAFTLPALGVALSTTLAARWLMRCSARYVWWLEWAILSLVGVAVLLAGLWTSGHDGKMATYAALVLCCATAQWALLRSPAR